MVRYRFGPVGQDDEDAQLDGEPSASVGDAGGISPFATSMKAAPWLRGGQPPWHMWGNSELVTASDTLVANTPGTSKQLCKISYARPETWHWVFAAKLVNAPDTIAGEAHTVSVSFDLIVGIGRSQIIIPSFEFFRWNWGDIANPRTAPIAFMKWSTQALGRVRIDPNTLPPGPADPWAATGAGIEARSTSNVITEIVAQDIQLQAVVTCGTLSTITATVEVSAQFSPKTHLRPEWYLDQNEVPMESKYPGSELGGR